MAAVSVLLTCAAVPFVVLFPEPPAFGPEAIGIAAAVGLLVLLGSAWRAKPARRRSIILGAIVLLGLTSAATALHILWATELAARIPTADLLAKLFGLQGEDIDDAVLYEEWIELWLACALLASAVMLLPRAFRRGVSKTPAPALAETWRASVPSPPWNVATVALCLFGITVLFAAVLDGHRTADFLYRANHVVGTIADPQDHPRIRFMTTDGTMVEFTQNNAVSRPLGAAVPVAYLSADPAGTAQADTVWANWSGVLGLVWIGLGFTVLPFFGFRAVLRPGRW